MAQIFVDSVLETTTTVGAGALTLAGPVTGYRSFGGVMLVGDTCKYSLREVDSSGNFTGAWETGLGTYSGTNTLTRTTLSQSSTSAFLVLAAGTKYVSISLLAEDIFTLGGGVAIAQGAYSL